jgi:hypothetical protein
VLIVQGTPLSGYSRGKGRKITQVVLHESVTASTESTVKVLAGRHLGVHFIVDQAGNITQHVHVGLACAHAEGFGKPSEHNETSIAVEVVNPYYGGDLECSWAHKGKYNCPPQVQLEAVWQLVKTLGVPLDFPANDQRGFRWGRWWAHEGAVGVMAHARWAHADGLFIEHYCWARARGYLPDAAFPLTVSNAVMGWLWTPLGPVVDVAIAEELK